MPTDLAKAFNVAAKMPQPLFARIPPSCTSESLQNADIRRAFERAGSELGLPNTPVEMNRLHRIEVVLDQGNARSSGEQPQ